MSKIINNDGTFLFDAIIFGPLKSRRFGLSLGINLLPENLKVCNFNCIYCECGFTDLPNIKKEDFYSRESVGTALEKKITELINNGITPECITFAGNGEPTLHPEFNSIIDDTIAIRNKFLPEAKITLLTNAAMLEVSQVREAILKVDLPVLKLDAGTEEEFSLINQPYGKKSLYKIAENILQLKRKIIIQSLFLKGEVSGKKIDNTNQDSVAKWISLLKKLHPEMVMIYSLDRTTPVKTIVAIEKNKLEKIAQQVKSEGINAIVS